MLPPLSLNPTSNKKTIQAHMIPLERSIRLSDKTTPKLVPIKVSL